MHINQLEPLHHNRLEIYTQEHFINIVIAIKYTVL
jgi:hypothetical protein